MSGHDAGRRRFMARSAAAAGVMAATAGAARSQAASALEKWSGAKPSVLLHDPRIHLPAGFLQRFDARGTRAIALVGDPVWFWRSAAGAAARDRATQLLGVTGWAELLVFRGLAAETRRHLRHEQFSAPGAFIWLIA